MTESHDDKPDREQPRPSRRSPWFWLFLVLAVLLLLPLLLVTAVLLVLRSETGTAWAIDQIPGLEVTEDRGSLFGLWQAKALNWQGYGVKVELDSPRIDWSPTCLLKKRLCLDTLEAQRLTVDVQPSSGGEEPGQQQGPSLPTVDLPLGLRIGDVSLGPFLFNGNRIWDRLELAASGSGADWQLDRAFYKLNEYTVSASGRVATRRDWPVNLDVSGTLPSPSDEDWTLTLNLSGSVRDLRVSGQSQGYLTATLDGSVAPLDPALPARLRVDSKRFRALETLPETLTLKDWFVSADGSLEAGFQTRGQATLPGTEGPVELSLRGLVNTAGANDVALVLTAPRDGKPGTASVTGEVSWQDGLKADAEVSLQAFPWYSMLVGVQAPPVRLNSLNGSVSWADSQYQADLQAGVEGPQGEAALATELEGDLSAVRLRGLSVETGAGSLTGFGSVSFAGPLSWQAGLQLDGFNPGYWLPLLEASLSGEVNTQGVMREEGIPDIRAQWALDGQWRSKPARASGALDSGSGSWNVSELDVAIGDNQLQGNGTWGDQLQGYLELALPAPGDLLAGLGGQLNARVSLGGTPDAPTGELALSGRDLAWRDTVSVSRLQLDGELQPGFRLDSELKVTDLESSGQQLESIELTARGTREDHHVELVASHPEAELQLALDGGLGEAFRTWQGALTRGRVDIPSQDQQWQLQSPAALAYGATGELTFGAHCWRWQESAICADDQTLLPTPSIAYDVENFPAAALAPLMPEGFRWRASLNGNIDVAVTEDGPRGEIRVDAGAGDFRILTDGEWETLTYDAFTTRLAMQPEEASLAIRLSGPKLGAFSVDAALDPRSPERKLDGQFSVEKLDVALLDAFIGLEEIAGEVNGQGRLSGPLMKPAVHGELALTDGRLVDPRLPVPMENVVLSLDLQGYSAQLSGRIRSNARSETTLDGNVNWQGRPEGRVSIVGKRVPFSLEPYAHLELAPDITVAFREGDLSVKGRVEVPRGTIEIKGLPPQAVSVSEDEIIVGAEPQEPLVRSLNMDVTVVVGEDQVTFSAFGLTGDLEGTLRIGNDMDTRGTLQLVDGRYEAYGQELELRRARLLFVGNLTQPYLDIEAVRTVGTVVAGIRLSGAVQSPSTEVFSNPDMPQTDALSYVILGRAPQSRGDEGQMSRAALSLGLTQANKLTGGIGEEFGIRELTLEAEGSGEQTSVVASGYLTDELSVRYGVGIFEPITTVALRYDLGKYFYLEAASGLAASLDIFYTRDF